MIMVKKLIKCSKGFKEFLKTIPGKTYEDKIMKLIELNKKRR